MSASNVSNEQLAMFMRAGEVAERFGPSSWDRNPGESNKRIMTRKLGEAKREGLYDSVASSGVHEPIDLAHEGTPRSQRPMVGDGHHRLAAAAAVNPEQFVPVRHHRTMDDVGMYSMDYG